MNVWTEHRNPEGRTYWFNTGTKQSVWEKPDELKTPFERALNQTKWKEYFSGGRKYYYNTETKESKWDMPDELLLVLEKVEKENQPGAQRAIAPAPAPGFTPVKQGGIAPLGGADPSSSSHPSQSNGATPNNLAVGAHTGGMPTPNALPHGGHGHGPNSALPLRPNLPDDPVIPHNGFQTIEEGEKAFVHLLRKAGVDANWTWDQTMRAIITDPLYKALNTLAEKKACWEKYTNGLKIKEQEEREARLAKLRPAIRNMLKGNPNVFYYSTFKTADKLFANHPIWQQAKIEAERKLIFEEYVAELKEREVAETRAARSRCISKVVALFKELDVNVVTKWRTARDMLLDSQEWNADAELRKLPMLDILLAFEDYSRVREREYEEQMRRAQVEKTRKERKAREAFKAVLQELQESGKLKARTKWKEVYPLFKDDNRYLDMLGNPGSNPLELFWDAVDALDQKLDAKVAIVEDVIKRHNASLEASAPASSKKSGGDEEMKGEEKEEKESKEDGDAMDVTPTATPFAVTPTTTWEEFAAVVNKEADSSLKALSDEELKLVFDTLHEQARKKQADEKRRHERRQRHLQEDLRYALKKLPEPIDVNMKYEDAVPLIENLPEYKALEDEEGRRTAFAKFIKRQKERLREAALSDDGGSTTSRKRKEPVRGHDDDRERDRDHKDRDRERERVDKRERDMHRGDRDRDRDRPKDYRGSRHHHHRYDDYDVDHRPRDYGRDKDDYRSSKYHRDDKDPYDKRRERDGPRERRMSRGERGGSHPPHWDEPPRGPPGRERSTSIYRDDYARDKREHEDGMGSDRAEKRMRYDEPEPERPKEEARQPSARAETPEEGEI